MKSMFLESLWKNIVNNFSHQTQNFIPLIPLELLRYFHFQIASEKKWVWVCSTQQIETLINHDFFHLEEELEFIWTEILPHPYEQLVNQFDFIKCFYQLLDAIFISQKKLIIIPYDLLFKNLIPSSYLEQTKFILHQEDIISQNELAKKLISLGYEPVSFGDITAGTFSMRGEIFEIGTYHHGQIRLIYFDDLIEFIYLVDEESKKVQRNKPQKSVTILPTPQHLLTGEYLAHFRDQIPIPSTHQKEKFLLRKNLFELMQNKHLPDSWSSFLPFFFPNTSSLCELLQQQNYHFLFIDAVNELNYLRTQLSHYERDFQALENAETFSAFFPPIAQQFNCNELDKISLPDIKTEFKFQKLKDLLLQFHPQASHAKNKFDQLAWLLTSPDFFIQQIIIFNSHQSIESVNHFTQKIKSQLQHEIAINILVANYSIKESYFEEFTQSLLLNLDEFFFSSNHVSSSHKSKKRKNVDLFAEHLATLKDGDYVVHQDLGIGKYLGLQNLSIGEMNSDFIILKFEGEDKVYIPVYKMNLLQKYADKNTDTKLSDLRNKKFEQEKQKARHSVRQLAFNLIRLEAERKSHEGFSFSPPDELYQEFVQQFSFVDTDDQAAAVEDVIDDMTKNKPMDRLICGDVGFGKTEVAMRAAFKAVLDHKQVAVLVPTTILCLQHFNNFKKRFQNFATNIGSLSRLNSPKECQETLTKLADGKIDIIIATHKILGKSVHFKDLGLVIVDEEHRFGVSDKEKLKLLRQNVDFLTLTATPIPRTLQLSFLGIRSLSLIQTPPPLRQAIKTSLIRDDDTTLRIAIEQEISRGGQVFFIHNKVMDIELIKERIIKLVPKIKIVIAHGQLPEKELEKRIGDFYQNKYDLLLATTIVESGIDIPTANTMIINNAHCYGLAQLHQLRGRIGRSDKKAFCYFVLPENKQITGEAEKRLESLQQYCDVGSGFALANSDLEIRGAGELLGAEQSGHIQNIGLETYLGMLKEEMSDIKGEKKEILSTIDVQIGIPSFIPENYISNQSARLKFYKKLSNAWTTAEINSIQSELVEIYGPLPMAAQALLTTLHIRNLIKHIGVNFFNAGKKSISLRFDQDFLSHKPKLAEKIIGHLISKPKKFKFLNPTSVLASFDRELNAQDLVDFSQSLLSQCSINLLD